QTVLEKLGIQPATGYDHQGHTRLRGSIPAGQRLALFRDPRLSAAAFAVLPKTLLADVRRTRGGTLLLRATLLEWRKILEDRARAGPKTPGKHPIDQFVDAFRNSTSGQAYIARLPRTVRERDDIVRELLLEEAPLDESADTALEALLQNVAKDPDGPKMMDRL